MPDSLPALSPEDAYRFLEALFPGGLQDPGLVEELYPEGWEKSPLRLAFHPTIEQQYKEHLGFLKSMERLKSLGRKNDEEVDAEDEKPEPVETFEEFRAKAKSSDDEDSVTRESEFAELLGLCLWDVFSDNHDVVTAENFAADIGSFRGAAGTISDFIAENSQTADTESWDRGYGYLDFYMGTIHVGGRTSLTPIYELIFRRLKSLGADWLYSFPRIHAFKFAKTDAPETDYSPSEALQKEQEEKEEARKMNKLSRELDEGALAAKRKARSKPPPETVAAYQNIYNRFPLGWPPDPYDPN